LNALSRQISVISQWGLFPLGLLLLIENPVVEQLWRWDMGQNQRRAGFGDDKDRAVAQNRLVQFHAVDGIDVQFDVVSAPEFRLELSIRQPDFARIVCDKAPNEEQGIRRENKKERDPRILLRNPKWPVELEEDCEQEGECKCERRRHEDACTQPALEERDLVPTVDVLLHLDIGSVKRLCHFSF
jgi:hypothetical protein